MNKLSLLFAFSLLFAAIYSQTCSVTFAGDEVVDLSGLTVASGGTYYTATYATNGDVYTWNICGTVEGTQCTLTGTAVCQASSGKYWSCGVYASQTLTVVNDTTNPGSQYVAVSYPGGDTCTGLSGQPKRSTLINLYCGSDATSVLSEASCSYTLQQYSEGACVGGSSGGVKVGWVGLSIMIAFILGFIVYIIVGVLIKWKKYEATGIDLIPNVDFWKDVPFLFKDGWVFTINKITCGKVCGGYSSI